MGNYVAWILIGLVAGAVCGFLTLRGNRNHDVTLDLIFGVVGAMFGGLLLAPVLGIGAWGNASYNFSATLVALVTTLAVLGAIYYRRYRAAR